MCLDISSAQYLHVQFISPHSIIFHSANHNAVPTNKSQGLVRYRTTRSGKPRVWRPATPTPNVMALRDAVTTPVGPPAVNLWTC